MTLSGDREYFTYFAESNSLLMDNVAAMENIKETTLLKITVKITDSNSYSSTQTMVIMIIPEF